MSHRPRPRLWTCLWTRLWTLSTVVALAAAAPLGAVIAPERSPELAGKEMQHPDLAIRGAALPLSELAAVDAASAHSDLDRLGAPADLAFVDPRGGGWLTLMPSWPLIPGDAPGNDLAWQDLGVGEAPADLASLEGLAWQAFLDLVTVRANELRIDPAEIAPGKVTVQSDGRILQIWAPRAIGGVPVRDSYLTAVVNRGNLMLFGAHQWGQAALSTRPRVSPEEARTVATAHAGPAAVRGWWAEPELLVLPTARGEEPTAAPLGQGYGYRLAWAVRPSIENDFGSWEALVDAHSGELLAFLDTNHYASRRRVQGGVYPFSNDGIGPEGVEQPGWPMPFDRVTTPGGVVTTDAGGNLAGLCIDGNITSNLAGQFVRMNDSCGAISLTSSGDIDFGTSPGTNCTTPGFGGPGNTHSSRTGFYELNRIKEMARGQTPAVGWLGAQLTANMNLPSVCNAFWNGVTVNFYREGSGCGNTGELAGVFDHEWGHGYDDNDAVPTVSNPGEGIADLYAALRLNDSCIGRGFFLGGGLCGGYGDPCTPASGCTGIRDVDFANRTSGLPHDVNWINVNCPGFGGPCGGAVHCEGAVYSEAVWDLYTRDLPALYGMSGNTALEATTRLTYLGAGNVGTWFQCVTPFGGCAATGGYLNFLAADDDDANLANGTPHMRAIFAAFNRHQIACNLPAPVDFGCAGTPAIAPVVTAAAGDTTVTLTWPPVPGATQYQIFRTDGVAACAFGKIRVGRTAATTFTDSGLQNGRPYSYIVIPTNGLDTCMGPASSCVTIAPVAGPDPCAPSVPIQYGTEIIDEITRTVSLTGFTDPIVVTGPASFNGSHPGAARIGNVTASSFQHTFVEWDYLDGNHANESIGYLVLDRGPQTVGGLAAEADSASVGTGFVTVSFNQTFSTPPVVQVQVASSNDPAAVEARVRNVTTTSFQVKLREEEGADGVHPSETVHWIAIEPGSTTLASGDPLIVGATGNSVTHAFATINFGASITNPVFLADLQTNDGNDTSALRHRNLGATSVEVKVEEEQSGDTETNHTTEVVGWLVIGN